MKFGLITEGITDRPILKNILVGFFDDTDIDITFLQPENEKEPAGWGKVLKYLQSTRFQEAFPHRDYIIIQIDTDCCQDWRTDNAVATLNVPIPDVNTNDINNSIKLQVEAIINLFVGLIQNSFGDSFYTQNKDKIIFAISVRSIECWLLPFHAPVSRKDHTGKITGCLGTLNREYLNPKYGFEIDPDCKGYNDFENYEKASVPLKKHSNLLKHYTKNPSLKIFVNNELKPRFP